MVHPNAADRVARLEQLIDMTLECEQGRAHTLEETAARLNINKRDAASVLLLMWQKIPPTTWAMYYPEIWEKVTPQEGQVLRELLVAGGRVVTYETLEKRLQEGSPKLSRNVIRAYVSMLRNKGLDIRLWSGRGYYLVGEIENVSVA